MRASRKATSSSGRSGSSSLITPSRISSSGRSAPPSAMHSRLSPASTSLPRPSTSPSVYRASRLPSASSSSADSNGRPPRPSGGPAGRSRKSTVPPGLTTAGGGWPALASVQRRLTGSYTAKTQVAPSTAVLMLPAALSSSSASRMTRSSRCASSSSGGRSRPARVCTAVRNRPMVAAACSPWPTTSPTTRPTRAPDNGITSNQSPPTPALSSAGR